MCGYSSVAPRGSCHRLMIDDAPMPCSWREFEFSPGTKVSFGYEFPRVAARSTMCAEDLRCPTELDMSEGCLWEDAHFSRGRRSWSPSATGIPGSQLVNEADT